MGFVKQEVPFHTIKICSVLLTYSSSVWVEVSLCKTSPIAFPNGIYSAMVEVYCNDH